MPMFSAMLIPSLIKKEDSIRLTTSITFRKKSLSNEPDIFDLEAAHTYDMLQ